jgi:hypothetical protein
VFVVVFAVLWYILPMTWRSPSSDSPSSEEEPADEEEEAGSPDGQDQESRGASSRR